MPDDAERLREIQDYLNGSGQFDDDLPMYDHCRWLLARLAAREEEIATDNKLLAERDGLLNEFPCPEHGPCVPYLREHILSLRTALRTVGEAGIALREKMKALTPALNSAFQMQALHGFPYTGDNWQAEVEALDAALALPAVQEGMK